MEHFRVAPNWPIYLTILNHLVRYLVLRKIMGHNAPPPPPHILGETGLPAKREVKDDLVINPPLGACTHK